MNWADHKERLRRFLRDPDGDIWGSELLLQLWNDSQRDLYRRTSILEDVEAVRVPPLYHIGYLYDWEWPYLGSDEGQCYQALRQHQQDGTVYTHRHEGGYALSVADSIADEGHHFTQPWEAFISGVDAGDSVPIWFPKRFDKAKIVWWDKNPIDYLERKQMQSMDSSWVTHAGKSFAYWRYNDIDNRFVLYPLPSSPVWDDYVRNPRDGEFVYTHPWESTDEYIAGDGQEWTVNSNDYEHVFGWEGGDAGGDGVGDDNVAMRSQWLFELGSEDVDIGILGFVTGDDESGSQAGGVVRRDETIFSGVEAGVAVDAISSDDNILVVFNAEPTDLEGDNEESDFPRYLTKYIEYDTLERAYSANTDGRIESLREYWAYRKEIGLQIIREFKSRRTTDRDYRLVTPGIPGRVQRRRPRLPDTYPAVYP